MKLINIGYGNLISSERMISVVSPDAAPIKRMVQDARIKEHLLMQAVAEKLRRLYLLIAVISFYQHYNLKP